MPLAAGTGLGNYEIVGLLGAGGMGEVYRSKGTKLKRDVAIKALPEAFARDPEHMAPMDEGKAELPAQLDKLVTGTLAADDGNWQVGLIREGENDEMDMPYFRRVGGGGICQAH